MKIVAATKYVSSFDMIKLLNKGINNFGENRVDAFLDKYEELIDYPIVWHFIGHLQRNKASLIINKIDYLHSLDSLKLANIINKEREKPLNCFVEVNLNNEESKSGIKEEDLFSFVSELLKMENIRFYGLMTMTKVNASDDERYEQFKRLKELLEDVNNHYGLKAIGLSMGMSDDYKLAIKASANYVRLGRILWTLKN